VADEVCRKRATAWRGQSRRTSWPTSPKEYQAAAASMTAAEKA